MERNWNYQRMRPAQWQAPDSEVALECATWLNERGLGYPLNLMSSLYYESTDDDPLCPWTEAESPRIVDNQYE